MSFILETWCKERNINVMRSKQRPVEKENWIRVENTHEPIIDRQLWDKVQKLLTKKHRDIDLETNKNIFAGFIKCGDCGRAMMKNFWRRADGSKVLFILLWNLQKKWKRLLHSAHAPVSSIE